MWWEIAITLSCTGLYVSGVLAVFCFFMTYGRRPDISLPEKEEAMMQRMFMFFAVCLVFCYVVLVIADAHKEYNEKQIVQETLNERKEK